MDGQLKDQLAAHLERYAEQRRPKDSLAGDQSFRVSYGTAGFRGEAAKIEHIFFNVGLIAALRCLERKANIGIMITASHNPIQDNGVKLVDSSGEMLEFEWEQIVEEFCNIHQTDRLLELLDGLVSRFSIDLVSPGAGRIMIGMDTRPSSGKLATLVEQGIQAWSPLVKYLNYKLVTTPVLHYLVGESNKRPSDNQAQVSTYLEQLISGIADLFHSIKASGSHYEPDQLVVDCANGVGYETMREFCKSSKLTQCLPLELINTTEGGGELNKLCGADFVKTSKLPPTGANDPVKRYASLDGDADRVVYFYLLPEIAPDNERKFALQLLDGDKLLALFALFLKDYLEKVGLQDELTLGAVQTAYANGASTEYLRKVLKLQVDCVDTGVKNLHRQAQNYDLGIYFEANGHGTICISEGAKSLIEKTECAHELQLLLRVINNYTGDAISNILVVEFILRYLDYDVSTWDKLYCDRPNSLIKVEVRDRSVVKTTNAGQTCLEPKGLQEAIDSVVGQFGDGCRSFARASGTENAVRIYAEANDQSSADRLAAKVGKLVEQFCNQ